MIQFLFGWQASIYLGLYHASLFTLVQWLIVHINNKLFQRFYDNNYLRYTYFSILVTIGFSILTIALDSLLFTIFENIIFPASSDRHPFTNSIWQRLIFGFIMHSILFGMTFIISTSIFLREREAENKIRLQKLLQEKTATELKFLKAQINPHFLFNALNNIYSCTYLGNEDAPNKILQLSDMLRYIIYDCTSEFVALSKEIEYLENFLKFQRMKSDHEQNIRFFVDTHGGEPKIAPMILIPFIENSFKHSKIDQDKTGHVNIEIKTEKDHLVFVCENTVPSVSVAPMLQKNKGVGLSNVKKRMDLIYGKDYHLDISHKSNLFRIELNIKMHG